MQATNGARLSMQLRAERREACSMFDGPTNDLPSIDEVLADPAASFWLKRALHSALCRDPSMPPTIRRSWHDCWKKGATKSCLGVNYICFAHPASLFAW